MNIRTAEKNDINNWMNLIHKVKDVFPGLETAKPFWSIKILCWILWKKVWPYVPKRTEK